MEIVSKIENGPVLIVPNIHEDDRGYFYESFNDKEFREKVADITFVQDNQSKSSYGVLRGMHFQKGEYAQAKLVRVVQGAVMDVVVDIRMDSPDYGKCYGYYLSEENHRQLFVPRGFAHGFVALRDNTIFQYKCDNVYNKKSEGSYRYDTIGYDWASLISWGELKISDKDKNAPLFNKNGNKKQVEISKSAITSICSINSMDKIGVDTIPFNQDIYAKIVNFSTGEPVEVKLVDYSAFPLYDAGDFSSYHRINVINEQTGYKGNLSPDLREVIKFYKYE